jgi:glutamate-1-semialdehyde 2,1-aminomutase
MITPFFTMRSAAKVENFNDATGSDTKAYARFFHAMLDHGVYLPPSQFEAWFLGLAHTEDVIRRTIDAANAAFRAVAS